MAASLNRIVLCGNLTADPELSYLPSGMAVVRLRLAVNERVKNQQDEWVDRPCFVDVSAFGRQAEACNEYLEKGSPVLLEGKLRYETWEAKEGGKRSKHSVVADKVQFLSTRGDSGSGGGSGGGSSSSSQSSKPSAPAPAPSKPPLADEDDDESPPPF